MADWHSVQDRTVHEKANFVREELRKLEVLINDVELFAMENQALPGYLEDQDIAGASAIARMQLVNIKDVLCKQIYGDNCATIESRKEFKERTGKIETSNFNE